MVTWLSEYAATRALPPTSRGIAAFRAGLENPVSPAASEVSTYRATSEGCSSVALSAMTPESTPSPRALHASILRLSTASPTVPP